MSARTAVTLLCTVTAVVALAACGASQATAPATTTTTTTATPAPVSTAAPDAWPPLIRCAGIDRAAGLGVATNVARANHVVNALLETASCWLTDTEFARLDAHRRTLDDDAPVVPAAYGSADHAARVLAPLALDAAGRSDDAAQLRALAPIVGEPTRAAAEVTLRAMTPEVLRRGALPPPGELMFAPSISLDDGHGCTAAHFPAGATLTAADAAVASAAMASINLADHGNNTADVRLGGSTAPPVSVTVHLGPETMYVGGAQGVATVACFAIQAGATRASVVAAVRDTLDAITAPQGG